MSSERQKDTAIEALVDAVCEIHGFALDESETNVLSALGNLVSKTVRREVLLRELQANEWNLAQVSVSLRLGYGSSPVLRAIRDLGLDAELKAARKAKQGRRTISAKEGVR